MRSGVFYSCWSLTMCFHAIGKEPSETRGEPAIESAEDTGHYMKKGEHGLAGLYTL